MENEHAIGQYCDLIEKRVDEYPPSLDETKRMYVKILKEKGLTNKEMAEKLGVSERTIYRILKKYENI